MVLGSDQNVQSQEFILVVLLVSFLDVPGWSTWSENGLEVIDLFAGKARISRLASWLGYKSRAFDLAYHPVRYPQRRKRGKLPRSCMDINGSAGLANLNPKKVNIFWVVFFHSRKFYKLMQLILHPHDLLIYFFISYFFPWHWDPHLRLAISLCLAGAFGKVLCAIGVVCSSWSIVNLHTSQRDPLTPYGDCSCSSVRAGNRMVARRGATFFRCKKILHYCYSIVGRYRKVIY